MKDRRRKNSTYGDSERRMLLELTLEQFRDGQIVKNAKWSADDRTNRECADYTLLELALKEAGMVSHPEKFHGRRNIDRQSLSINKKRRSPR